MLTRLYFSFFKGSFFLYNGIFSDFFNCSGKMFSVIVWFITLVKNGSYACTHCFKIVTGVDPLVQCYFKFKFIISFLKFSLEASWKIKSPETMFWKDFVIFFVLIWLFEVISLISVRDESFYGFKFRFSLFSSLSFFREGIPPTESHDINLVI